MPRGSGTPSTTGILDVRRAAERLSGVAHRTPVLRSRHLDALAGAELFLKAEHLQRVGAFKFRGAYNAVATLPADTRAHGVVASSSGNHAQAVALAASLFGIPATIVMPEDAPPAKLAATRGYGATVITYDRYREDREAIGRDLAAQTGAEVIPPFDDIRVMAGQGTVALELLEDVDELDVLVTPVGGGGLLGGCAVVAAALRPEMDVVGAEPAVRRAARAALERHEVVEVPVPRTLLDGQQTTAVGVAPLAALRQAGATVVGVEDAEVIAAMRLLASRAKQVVEPSGAAGLAAVLAGHIPVSGRRVGIVLSGGNVDLERFARLVGPRSGS